MRTLDRVMSLALFIALIGWLSTGVSPSSAQSLEEALDTTNLVWTTGGDAAWFAQTTSTHDGVDAVQSAIIGSNQTSWIETTVIGPATVNFWVGAGYGGSYTYWYLTVSNDSWPPGFGRVVHLYPFRGQPYWYQQVRDLAEGTNVLRWTHSNHSGNQGYVVIDEVMASPPRPLAIEWQSQDQTVFSGEWPWLSVSAVGTPPLQYQWQKDGTNVMHGTNAFYGVEQVTTNDSGVYSVTISNSQGFVVSSNAVLSVQPPTAPFFTSEPASATVYSGQSFYWFAGVSGSPPFTHQWRKDGVEVPGATWSSLTLTNVTLADAGSYTLAVSNDVGSVESSNAVLTVLASVAPSITRQPRSLEVAEGTSTWLSCVATGAPEPYCSWTKVGAAAPSNPTAPPFSSPPPAIGPGRPALSFTNATTNDAGIYFATATNYGGVTVSREALLAVLPPLALRGSWWQGAVDVFVTNGFAYLAQGNFGLGIVSVSNPVAPMMLGGYNTPGYATAVRVANGLAFIADGYEGLQIISVTNPYSPVRLGGYNTTGYACDLAIRSNLVFLADGQSGLVILDIGNPAAPLVTGSYSTNVNTTRICVDGNFVYLASSKRGIPLGSTQEKACLVIDISDPTRPIEARRRAGGVEALDVHGGILFTSTGYGMNVFDSRNPAGMELIGSFVPFFGPLLLPETRALRVAGDLAYLACLSNGLATLVILDVRDPQDPIPVGFFSSGGGADALWVDGNRVYLSGSESILQIIETPFNTQPHVPPLLSLSSQDSMKLHVQGRRGLHYSLESAADLVLPDWQPLQTMLLTNEAAVIEVPPQPTGRRFFRLRQLD